MNRRPLAAAALVFQIAVASSVAAQPQSVADIAHYTALDRQAVLEAGARREGKLGLRTADAHVQPLLDRFREKYPFIRLEASQGPNVFLDGTVALRALRDKELLQPYRFPDMAIYPAEAVEPERHWVVDHGAYLNLAYNLKSAPEAGSIRTYDDLLDPRWKGKLTISDWGSTAAYWVGAMVFTKGEEFVRRLGRQEIALSPIDPRALADLVVSGKVPVSPTIYSSDVAAVRRRDPSIGWRALGPTWVDTSGVALARTAPHPHAAMLLIDFLLSREGQKIRQDMGQATARVDMENADRPPLALYLAGRPDNAPEVASWRRLAADAFGASRVHP